MPKNLKLATVNGKKPVASAEYKTLVTAKAQELLDSVFVPQCIKPPPTDLKFNYLSALYCKWRGNSFYFCATYTCPGPDAVSPSFETKFARMDYVTHDRFNLFFMRHTGQWIEIESNWTLEQCLHEIRDNEFFSP